MSPWSVMYGLASAITFGTGDFFGGMAAKRCNPYGVVILAQATSLCPLVFFALALGDPFLCGKDWLWAGAAGVCGAIGLTLLYMALASGTMSVAAPISALMAAALPVLVGLFIDGPVARTTLAGLGLALLAIWLISGGTGLKSQATSLLEPAMAGASFGGFFICVHMASSVSTLWPLVAVRIVSILSLLTFTSVTRQNWIPARGSWHLIFLNGALDTAGNALYILSARAGRMDIATVLGALYPASTVAMAYFILQERISRWQFIGMLAALIAIVMITS